ncbi:hypothetical protein E4U25_000847, partial [Claviceps purpurea]
APDFSASQALGMFQETCCMNYAIATLTLSSDPSRGPAYLRAKHERLLGVIYCQQTPEQPREGGGVLDGASLHGPNVTAYPRATQVLHGFPAHLSVHEVLPFGAGSVLHNPAGFSTFTIPGYTMRIRAALRALVRWGGDWSLDSGETSKRYRVNGDNGLDLVLCENIACLEKWMTRYGIEGDWHLMDALGSLRLLRRDHASLTVCSR